MILFLNEWRKHNLVTINTLFSNCCNKLFSPSLSYRHVSSMTVDQLSFSFYSPADACLIYSPLLIPYHLRSWGEAALLLLIPLHRPLLSVSVCSSSSPLLYEMKKLHRRYESVTTSGSSGQIRDATTSGSSSSSQDRSLLHHFLRSEKQINLQTNLNLTDGYWCLLCLWIFH